jgi:HD superfamily phosphodiesterase
MNYQKKILKLALPFLKKGVKKDFVLHTKGVVKAVKVICKKEPGDIDLLVTCAILHDVGWAEVPASLQTSKKEKDVIKGLKLHLDYSKPIIKRILKELNFKSEKINKIIEIVYSHKFKNPKDINKQILIDADALSDSFKEQFLSDAKSYKMSVLKFYKFRKATNKFYTKTAKEIFEREIEKRKNS